MSERAIRYTSVVLASSGAAIAGYLLYVRTIGGVVACTTGGCGAVQHSSYATVLGLPVAALGLVGFLGIATASLLRGDRARLINATLAVSAFLFALYLLVIQLVVIDAICEWCIASDVITTMITALALLRLRADDVEPAISAVPVRPYPKRRPNGSRGPSRQPRQRTRSR